MTNNNIISNNENNQNNFNFNKFIRPIFNVNLDNVKLLQEKGKTNPIVVFYDNQINDFNFIDIKDFFSLFLKYNKDFEIFLNSNIQGNTINDKLKNFILNFKTTTKQYKYLKFDMDLTSNKNYIKTDNDTLICVYNNVILPEFKELKNILRYIDINNINVKEYRNYITTYIKYHFKELNDILEFLTLFLFYTDKKQSFMSIVSKSNFGKTDFFIKLIVNRLGFGNKVLQSQLEYSPSPLKIEDFVKKGTMIIDEFKVFKGEFKEMTDEIVLNPKNGRTTNIGLFGKLFFSKERSVSFTGVVDEQIINRVLLIDKSKDTKTIGEFLNNFKFNGDKLKDYLTIYFRNFIDKRIKYYKTLDNETRDKILEKRLQKLQKKYSLKDIETTESYIKKVFYTYIKRIIDEMNEQETNELSKYIINDDYYFKLEDNFLYITKFEKLLETILKNENESFFFNVKKSLSNTNILDIVEKGKQKKILKENRMTTLLKLNFDYLNELTNNETNNNNYNIKELKNKLENLETMYEYVLEQNKKYEKQIEQLNYENIELKKELYKDIEISTDDLPF